MWFKQTETKKLLKAKLSGNISAEQEEKLQKILDNSKEEQIRFEQMLELDKQLKESKPPDETINVSANVMHKIRNSRTIRSNRNKLDPFINPMILRLAAVLVIGIFLGAIITWMITSEKLAPGTETLVGSLTAPANQEISYLYQNNIIKVVPYQIENLYYVNFILNTRSEIQMDVSFQENDLKLVKANYIASSANESINLLTGSISFAAAGNTSFQIIFKKLHGSPTGLNITAQQANALLFTKKIALEK